MTMALMARSLGLPAGSSWASSRQATPDRRTITGGMVTAWVEIPFAGVGWVAFDPTPDEAKVPQQKDDKQSAASRRTGCSRRPPRRHQEGGDPVGEGRRSGGQQQDDKKDDDLPPPASGDRSGAVGADRRVPAGAADPVALILGLKLSRRRRRRDWASGRGSPAAGPRSWTPLLISGIHRYQGPPGPRPPRRGHSFGGGTAVLARAADSRCGRRRRGAGRRRSVLGPGRRRGAGDGQFPRARCSTCGPGLGRLAASAGLMTMSVDQHRAG